MVGDASHARDWNKNSFRRRASGHSAYGAAAGDKACLSGCARRRCGRSRVGCGASVPNRRNGGFRPARVLPQCAPSPKFQSLVLTASTIPWASVEQQVVAMAEWMIHMMDRPPGWRPSYQEIWNPATREYRVPIPHQHLVTAGFAGDHHSGAHRGRESRRYLVTRRPELWPFAGATDSVDLAD